MDPPVLKIAQKVVKSLDNITTKLYDILQAGSFCSTANRDDSIQTERSWTSDMAQKAASGKARLVNYSPQYMHTWFVC